MVLLRLWIERERLITARYRRLLSVQQVRAELAAGLLFSEYDVLIVFPQRDVHLNGRLAIHGLG